MAAKPSRVFFCAPRHHACRFRFEACVRRSRQPPGLLNQPPSDHVRESPLPRGRQLTLSLSTSAAMLPSDFS